MSGPTIAFIDCSAGIAGDMLLGALIDAGAPLDKIKRGLESLHGIKGEWELTTNRVWKGPGSIAGTKANVGSIYQHKEAGGPTPSHAVQHDHGHGHSHSHSHTHSHGHDDDTHTHDEVEVQAVSLEMSHDHSHDHDHEHDLDHEHVHGGEEGEPMRNLDDIKALIAESGLSDWAKEKSVAVFTLLAQAEAHTHGTSLEEIHFHEVGAIDSIVDTIGSVIALNLLGVREVHASFLPFSSGAVKCMHGVLPVPPPATFRLMIGVPVCPAPKGAKGELVTPTGISLVKVLASTFGEPPAFIPTHTGVGAELRQSCCCLEVIGYVSERLLSEHHALDVWKQPIQMKKNRPGVCLSVLCRAEHERKILETIFRETSTLGVRRNAMDRVFLSRKFVSVSAFGRSVDVKVAFLSNEAVNVHPEFEHCKAIAVEQNIPLIQVIDEVKALALPQIKML
ncbi:hypothetical protein PI124_g3347 [Phytophthora idaei]|nr:hypothetical protein PI125_g8932 [Phytophthora idaei]KAG3154743.1 hypothetical protein PI126_g9491 [Phytophthora idaei]KAG3252020.1 hypothetical protein PI124_g3347 [Phytophthora idaei]